MNTTSTKRTAASSDQATDDAGAAAPGDTASGESMPAARRTRTRKPAQEGRAQDKFAGTHGGSRNSKTEIVLKKLRTARGATLAMLMEATGWQAHSVRGFLSGTVRRKLGLTLVSEIGKDGTRHYRIPGRS